VAAIVMFLIFTPIAVLATDTKEEQTQTQMQIIKTEEEKYIIYVKDLQKEEFNYAIANTPTAKEMELKYIHSSKDDEQNSVIVIDKNVYNVKQNEKAYLWIKQGEREIITGKEIDFSQSFEKSKIEEVENTGKRIKTEIISNLVQEERTDENGVKITVKVGGIKIKDNQNARYFYQIMPATNEYGTLVELAGKIKNEYSQMDMYEKINVAKEFYNKYSNLPEINDIIKKDHERNKYYIDTVLINKCILKKLGLIEENIIDSNICTVCNSNLLHSYRKAGENSGRNMAIIEIKK